MEISLMSMLPYPTMTINNWLTILAIVAGATVSLIVAHLHRKQMRQIELHRADPSVTIIPPPHPITLFFKNYGLLMLNVFVDLGVLVDQLSKTGPLLRGQVFVIALATAALFWALLMEQVRKIYLTIDRIIDVIQNVAKLK